MGVPANVSALSRLEQRAENLACHNVDSMSNGRRYFGDARGQALLAAVSIAGLAVLHWLVPLSNVHLHSFLQHLVFVPIVLAGICLGWRGAILSTLFTGALLSPHILRTWRSHPVYAMDMVLELPVFGLAGLVAGLLAERERGQRARLEKTKGELEDVYRELQQNVESLKRAERLYAAGQLSAGLAHEIRNPLASITGAAGILKRGHASFENNRECLEIIEKETTRLNRLLSGFLDFARPRPPRFQRVDLIPVLESVIGLAQHAGATSQIDLQLETQDPLPMLRCDPEQVKQVLLNLVINAVQSTDGPGVVSLQASRTGDRIRICVRDQGCGMSPGVRDCIFDPFFTTKENGTGLGLAVAAKIVEQHGGLITAENNPDRGTTFLVEFPLDTARPL